MKSPDKKFTKNEIFSLYNALQTLGDLKGVKFAYAIARNINICKPEVEALQEALKGSDEFLEFEAKRVELAKEYSKKDENGKPLSERGAFVMADEDKFNKKLEELKNSKEYKDVTKIREEQVESWEKLLEEESSLKLYSVALESVPEELTVRQMTAIADLVNEDDEAPAKKK